MTPHRLRSPARDAPPSCLHAGSLCSWKTPEKKWGVGTEEESMEEFQGRKPPTAPCFSCINSLQHLAEACRSSESWGPFIHPGLFQVPARDHRLTQPDPRSLSSFLSPHLHTHLPKLFLGPTLLLLSLKYKLGQEPQLDP